MILEVLKEVCTPSVADEYKYIGFGASFFADFKLTHRNLHVNDMVSIESNGTPENRKRCEFNKPFSCINISFGFSKDQLPKIKME